MTPSSPLFPAPKQAHLFQEAQLYYSHSPHIPSWGLLFHLPSVLLSFLDHVFYRSFCILHSLPFLTGSVIITATYFPELEDEESSVVP